MPDKASRSEAIAGTNDTKYVTPYALAGAIDAGKNTLKDQEGVEYGVETQSMITVSKSSTSMIGDVIGWIGYSSTSLDQYARLNYDYAYKTDRSAVIDVGDYIVGAWSKQVGGSSSNTYAYGYHIIAKSDLNVASSSSYTAENYYRFIAKAENNAVYYMRGSTLYYARVIRGGFSGVKTIATITGDPYRCMRNDNYLVLISSSGSQLITVSISNNSVRNVTLSTSIQTTPYTLVFLGEYLISYAPGNAGQVSYTRANVVTGTSNTTAFVVMNGSTATGTNVLAYQDQIKNVAFLECFWKDSDGTNTAYYVVANSEGIITKKIMNIRANSSNDTLIFSAESSSLVSTNRIVKYTLSTITEVSLSFPEYTDDIRFKYVIPNAGYIYDIYGYITILLDTTFSKIFPITIPYPVFNITGLGDSLESTMEIVNIYKTSSGGYAILVANTIWKAGYSTVSSRPLFWIYHVFTPNTHNLVTVKLS